MGGVVVFNSGVRVLAAAGTAIPHTGTVAKTTLATITVPPMGPNDRLRISTLWSMTNSANNKTFSIDLAGTNFMAVVHTASTTFKDTREIVNRGSSASQVCFPAAAAGANNTGSAVSTGTVATSSATALTLSGTLANTGETITLEAYTVELIKP
jgi:hypothetical protein